jgi:putative membrane protein
MALVTGIYDQLIDSAAQLLSTLKHLVMDPDRWIGARVHRAAVRWRAVVLVAVGMVVALVLVADARARPRHHRVGADASASPASVAGSGT